MTREERAALRRALLGAGFGHLSIGYDEHGTGAYTEVWVNGDNKVTIDWGPRVPTLEQRTAKIGGAG